MGTIRGMLVGVLLSVLPVTAARARQEPGVFLRPIFTANAVARYDMSARYESRRGTGEDAPGLRIVQAVRLRLETASVNAAGAAAIRASFERLRVEVTPLAPPPPPGETAEPTIWEWTGEGEPTLTGRPIERLAESLDALRGAAIDIVVRRDGTISSVRGLEPVQAIAAPGREAPADPTPVLALGVFTPEAAPINLAAFWLVDPQSGHRARGVGESWSLAQVLPVSDRVAARSEAKLTLARLEGTSATIEGPVEFSVVARGEGDPTMPHMTLAEQSGRLAIEWDTARGLLRRRVAERSLTWVLTLGPEAPLESRHRTVGSVTIALVGP